MKSGSVSAKISVIRLSEQIKRFASDMGGVFLFADLWNLMPFRASGRVAKVLERLVREKVLFKIRRGVYSSPEADLWVVASRMKENGYVSMDSVLARNGLIGTVPSRSVSFVYPGPTQSKDTPFGRIRYFKIKRELIFGVSRGKHGVQSADNEKAYLDMLYYHLHGNRFVADPLRDVDLKQLDLKRIKRYLDAYGNPKFKKFVEGVMNEND